MGYTSLLRYLRHLGVDEKDLTGATLEDLERLRRDTVKQLMRAPGGGR